MKMIGLLVTVFTCVGVPALMSSSIRSLTAGCSSSAGGSFLVVGFSLFQSFSVE